jgi:hypothetical protein
MSKAQKGLIKKSKSPEYDSAWKDIMEEHFESFLEFFFEEIHRDIDFERGYEFLDQELRKIAAGNKSGKRLADVLAKVYLKDGSEKYICIYIHIEVQGNRVPEFMVRIYMYNYRIFDKYKDKGVEVVSLAILTDEDENYRPDEYLVKRWGFEQRMKIPIVKIIDFRIKQELIDKLEQSKNPMAMVVRAQLRSYEAKRVESERKYDIKSDLIRQCFARGYRRKQIESLLKFIDWIISLPKELEDRLSDEIIKIEEVQKMTYVTSWERNAEERGMKRGIERGERIGIERGERIGMEKEKLETAKRMLNRGVSIEDIMLFTGLSEKKVRSLLN